jgi:hypothetical protein
MTPTGRYGITFAHYFLVVSFDDDLRRVSGRQPHKTTNSLPKIGEYLHD